jgi:hypothetical protein
VTKTVDAEVGHFKSLTKKKNRRERLLSENLNFNPNLQVYFELFYSNHANVCPKSGKDSVHAKDFFFKNSVFLCGEKMFFGKKVFFHVFSLF